MKLFLYCAFVLSMFAAESERTCSSQDLLTGNNDAVMESLMRFAMNRPEFQEQIHRAYLQILKKKQENDQSDQQQPKLAYQEMTEKEREDQARDGVVQVASGILQAAIHKSSGSSPSNEEQAKGLFGFAGAQASFGALAPFFEMQNKFLFENK